MNPNLRLGADLGFSCYFTAVVVATWREKFPRTRELTAVDLLDPSDPSLRYAVVRAVGTPESARFPAPTRLNARVEKWLGYFADSGRSLPTHEGDTAFIIRVPDAEPPAFRLV